MKKSREQEFLKTLPSTQPKQLTLFFPAGCSWDQGSFNNYPSPHSPLKSEWINLLRQISTAKSTDTLTLFLDCNYVSLSQVEDLVKIISRCKANIQEVAVHNIEGLIPYSMDPSLCFGSSMGGGSGSMDLSQSQLSKSVLSKSILSQSVVLSRSIFTELAQEEQASLTTSMQALLGNATKVNLTNLPLMLSSTCDLIFNILNNLTCSELAISSNNTDPSLVSAYLNYFISQNKNIAKLDISKICQMYQSEELLGSVVAASVDNPKIQIKYSDAIYSKNNVPFGFKFIFDFSALRMEPVKEDFIKSLLQVANKLATEYGYPKEIIAHIMTFVDPYSYMETCSMYQPDGQHIMPLLGWDSAHESVDVDLS